jgi:hypothetical protein
MRTLLAALILVAATQTARAADPAPDEIRYAVGFGAGPQSGHGLHLRMARGLDAVDLGLGLIYDGNDAEWGYSTGLRYLRTLYASRVNDTYAWTGGAVTGNYRDQTASHITSFGAGLGISFHFGLPIHLYFDSGLAAYISKGFAKKEYYPAFNGGIVYEW